MKYNKCLIAGEKQSRRCRSGIRGRTDLCVSAGGPWGDGRCGRTCHSRGNPWRTSPGCAHDAGAETAECSPPPSPRPPQHLEHAQGGRDKWKVCWVPLQTSPPTHHNTTRFFFSLLLCLSLIVPRFPLLKCANGTQSQTHQTGSQAALFPSLTERWQFISFSLETPQSWDTPPTPHPQLKHPENHQRLFFLLFFFSFFYPSYHHHSH